MEFHDSFPNYEILAQHDEATGAVLRKKLLNVFWLLLIITIIEVLIGAFWPNIRDSFNISKTWLIVVFIAFTLLKAGYIVFTFMHLGDENRALRWTVLAPVSFFIVYLVYLTTISEGTYLQKQRDLIDPALLIKQEATIHHAE